MKIWVISNEIQNGKKFENELFLSQNRMSTFLINYLTHIP